MPVIQVKRIYEEPSASDGMRILVGRIWPRGISKWAKDVAPSTELRQWFHRDVSQWDEFRKRYLAELEEKSTELAALRVEIARHRGASLLTAAANSTRNHATVLKSMLE